MAELDRWTMAHEKALETVREGARQAELLDANLDPSTLRMRYAGQWVAILDGQVIASAPDGRELVKVVNVHTFPSAVIYRIPTLEEQEGIWVL